MQYLKSNRLWTWGPLIIFIEICAHFKPIEYRYEFEWSKNKEPKCVIFRAQWSVDKVNHRDRNEWDFFRGNLVKSREMNICWKQPNRSPHRSNIERQSNLYFSLVLPIHCAARSFGDTQLDLIFDSLIDRTEIFMPRKTSSKHSSRGIFFISRGKFTDWSKTPTQNIFIHLYISKWAKIFCCEQMF